MCPHIAAWEASARVLALTSCVRVQLPEGRDTGSSRTGEDTIGSGLFGGGRPDLDCSSNLGDFLEEALCEQGGPSGRSILQSEDKGEFSGRARD